MSLPGSAASRPALTVLVVESSPVLGERLARLAIGQPGIAAAVAVTLGDSLAQLRASRFDVVAVDVVGPTCWPELVELRQLRMAAPHSTLVALAADGEPETVEACRALGADHVLPLDTGLSVFEDLLAAHLASRKQETP